MIPRVAVVEDEEALSVLLRYNLEAEGFEVDTILRGDEAEIRLQERTPGSSDPRLDAAGRFRHRALPPAAPYVRKPSACRSSC